MKGRFFNKYGFLTDGFCLPQASLFFVSPKKSKQKKGDPTRSCSCALRKMAVVPTRHPCLDVTKTHFLCVFQPFSSSARRTRMGGWIKSEQQEQRLSRSDQRSVIRRDGREDS